MSNLPPSLYIILSLSANYALNQSIFSSTSPVMIKSSTYIESMTTSIFLSHVMLEIKIKMINNLGHI
jgi:hypothetical protein